MLPYCTYSDGTLHSLQLGGQLAPPLLEDRLHRLHVRLGQNDADGDMGLVGILARKLAPIWVHVIFKSFPYLARK